MTTRAHLLLAGFALLVPVVFIPALEQPILVIALAAAIATIVAAVDSVAWPVGLAGVGVLLIGALGHNPFPNKALALFTFFWIALAVAISLLRRSTEAPFGLLVAPPVVLTLLLGLWQLVRLGGSGAPGYGEYKLQLFVAQNLALVVAGVLIARRARSVRIYLVLVLLMAAGSGVLLALGLSSGEAEAVVGGRYSASSGQSPIELGRQAALGLLVGTFVLLASRGVALRLLALVTMPVIAVAFISSGSRGPVLGLATGLLVLLLLTIREPGSRRRLALVAGGAVAGAVFVSRLVPPEDVQRSLSVITGSEGGLSSNGRFELWSSAWRAFLDHPLGGIGTGGFAAVNPSEVYPHNLVLEVASELGLVGLVLLAATLAYAVAALVAAWRRGAAEARPTVALVAALLASTLFNSLVSSNLPTNNALWLAFGLAGGLLPAGGLTATFAAPLTRWRSQRERAPRPFASRPSRTPDGDGDPGAILEPSPGATVHGRQLVRIRPAETQWRMLRLIVEARSQGEDWATVSGDETFDLVASIDGLPEHVGVVRSQRLAEQVRAALEPQLGPLELAPAPRRAWRRGDGDGVVWDTTALADGPCELRAVTIDAAGGRTVTPPVEILVDNQAAAAREAELEAARARESDKPSLQRRADELEALGRELSSRLKQVEARAGEVAEEREALAAEREAARARRAGEEAELRRLRQEVEARERELGARLEEVGAREQELSARLEQVEARAGEVAEEREALVAEREALAAARREAEEREAALAAEREAALAARREAEEREAALVAEREALTAAQREAEEREAALAAEREAALAARREAEEREAALVAEREALAAAQREAEEREAALAAEREAALAARRETEEREAALVAEREALAAAQREAEEREAALAAEREAALAARREAEEREAALVAEREALAAAQREAEEREAALAAEREAALAARREAEEREAALVAEREALAAAQREAEEREAALVAEREAARQAAEREAQAREAERAEAPQELPPSTGQPVVRADERMPTLAQLEAVAAANAARFPERVDEWDAYLMAFREHADYDGRLPLSLDGVVDEVFGDLL